MRFPLRLGASLAAAMGALLLVALLAAPAWDWGVHAQGRLRRRRNRPGRLDGHLPGGRRRVGDGGRGRALDGAGQAGGEETPRPAARRLPGGHSATEAPPTTARRRPPPPPAGCSRRPAPPPPGSCRSPAPHHPAADRRARPARWRPADPVRLRQPGRRTARQEASGFPPEGPHRRGPSGRGAAGIPVRPRRRPARWPRRPGGRHSPARPGTAGAAGHTRCRWCRG